jgi:glucuronokinase
MPAALPHASAQAPARVGLLGNPGDVYEGRALALAFWDFRATVTLAPAQAFEASGPARDLLRAAVGRLPELPHTRFALTAHSDIPLQVGLAGSSAIVVAAMKACCAAFALELQPADLAERALAAEVEDLGITAGPMDRVIQAYGGLVAMDLRLPRGPRSYRRLDPACLPPLFVAWNPAPGQRSDVPHDTVRARWEAGDPAVHEAMACFARLAQEGVACLEAGDHDGFRRCMDANFDARARIWPTRPRDVELVEVGRAQGAAVKYAGSGGAVVGALRDAGQWPAVAKAYAEAGFPCLRPRLAP